MDSKLPVPAIRRPPRPPRRANSDALVVRDASGKRVTITEKMWRRALDLRRKGKCDITIAKALRVHIGVLYFILNYLERLAGSSGKVLEATPEWQVRAHGEWYLERQAALSLLDEVAYEKALEGSLAHIKYVKNQDGQLAPGPGDLDPNRPHGGGGDHASRGAALRNTVTAIVAKHEHDMGNSGNGC